jgi:hypothetical protein
MQELSSTTNPTVDVHVQLCDLAAMIPGWDSSRPASELLSVLKERLSNQPTIQTGKRRGKSMSRRKGQHGTIEAHGAYYTVRARFDVEGQEKRAHQRIRISPIKRGAPGWLNRAERHRKAAELLFELGANSEERFNAIVKPAHSRPRTFAEQSKIFLRELRERDKPAAEGTLENWENCLRKWLIPMLGNLPLERVNNGALKRLVSWMKNGGAMPAEGDVNEE